MEVASSNPPTPRPLHQPPPRLHTSTPVGVSFNYLFWHTSWAPSDKRRYCVTESMCLVHYLLNLQPLSRRVEITAVFTFNPPTRPAEAVIAFAPAHLSPSVVIARPIGLYRPPWPPSFNNPPQKKNVRERVRFGDTRVPNSIIPSRREMNRRRLRLVCDGRSPDIYCCG